MKIAVLGGGAWGTVVAQLLAENGHEISLWCFEQAVVDDIVSYSINKRYLPGIELHEKIVPTASISEALRGAEIIFEAVPVPFLRDVLVQAKEFVSPKQRWVMLSKGIERDTKCFPVQITQDVIGDDVTIAVLSGPNKAMQLADRAYTVSIIASSDESFAQELQKICSNEYFATILTNDVAGVQVAGALKNVISILLGVLESSGYSENTLAAFVTFGLAEMVKFAEALGGWSDTVYGPAGLGDLVLGLLGEKTRNYHVGTLFGEGNSLNDIGSMMPVLPEGVCTVKSVYQILETHGLDLPICKGLYEIMYEGKSVRSVLEGLMR